MMGTSAKILGLGLVMGVEESTGTAVVTLGVEEGLEGIELASQPS